MCPTDFLAGSREEIDTRSGQFSPGNERMTPPIALRYIPSESGKRKEKDANVDRTQNWLTMYIPNPYHTFSP